MNAEKIIKQAMKELEDAEIHERLAAESRCKAKRLLASVYSPAPSGGKKKAFVEAQIIDIRTRKQQRIARKLARVAK